MRNIKEIIDEWDPLDLLLHAPNDEYHSEIQEIEEIVKKATSIEMLANEIYQVFKKSFSEVYTGNLDDCISIAKKILIE